MSDLTLDDMKHMAPDDLQRHIDRAVQQHREDVDALTATLREIYAVPPLTYVSPAHADIGAEVAPASRWQRLRWWLRRVGR